MLRERKLARTSDGTVDLRRVPFRMPRIYLLTDMLHERSAAGAFCHDRNAIQALPTLAVACGCQMMDVGLVASTLLGTRGRTFGCSGQMIGCGV